MIRFPVVMARIVSLAMRMPTRFRAAMAMTRWMVVPALMLWLVAMETMSLLLVMVILFTRREVRVRIRSC